MVIENEPLVYHVYYHRIEHGPLVDRLEEDLLQEGRLGLVKGCRTYDPSSGFALSTYLAKCIENEMLKLLRAEYRSSKLNTVSTEEVVSSTESGEITLGEVIPDPEDERQLSYEMLVDDILNTYSKHVVNKRNKNMKKNIDTSSNMVRKILEKLCEGKTLSSIGDDLGVSKQYVHSVLRGLRHILVTENYPI